MESIPLDVLNAMGRFTLCPSGRGGVILSGAGEVKLGL